MLCPGCFSEETNSKCHSCGYDLSLKRSPLLLPHHSKLNLGRYVVGRLIGRLGGFGVTYLALDTRLQTIVAIKEYLPRDIAGRDANHITVHSHTSEDEDSFKYGLSRFLDEARTLAKLDHPNIVRVRDFFEENGTAYLVMDYCQGLTLSEYIKRQPTGKVDQQQAVSIVIPILDGLREVHQKGFLHRDIKPQNIYLTSGNRPILLDFGAARQSMGERSKSLSVVLSEGYAPFEQYQRNGKQGPWTDIYGVAATLYNMVAGENPPSAMDRISEDTGLPGLHSISPSLRQAIESGMHSSIASRTQNVDGFQNELLNAMGEKKPSSQEAMGKLSTQRNQTRLPINHPIKSAGAQHNKRVHVGFSEVAPLALVPFVLVSFLGLAVFVYFTSAQKIEEKVEATRSNANIDITIERHGDPHPAPIIPPVVQAPTSPPGQVIPPRLDALKPAKQPPVIQPPAVHLYPPSDENAIPPPKGIEPEKPKLSVQDQDHLNQAKTARVNLHSSSASSWSSNDYRRAASAFREAARIDSANRKTWSSEEKSALKKAETADAKLRQADEPQTQPDQLKDTKLRKWAAKNPWFGTEATMTEHATKYSNGLIQSGVDPTSDKYYKMVDSEMRRAYPSYFQVGSSRSGGGGSNLDKQQMNLDKQQIDEKAQRWARRNPWFGTEPSMTAYARKLHEKLVKSGTDPTSEKYYREIDGGVRKAFPDYFSGTN